MARTAELYRMVMDDHLCPYGLKSKDLLELKSRSEADAFMEKHGVQTTPQAWIDGKRISGYEALREHFGHPVEQDDETTYRPIIVILSVAALMALAMSWAAYGELFTVRAFEWFIAVSMCFLAGRSCRIWRVSPRCSSTTIFWRGAGSVTDMCIPSARRWLAF